MTEIFRYIQLSDLHLCVEDSRHNVHSLHRRNLRTFLDTNSQAGRQRLEKGWLSLLKPASYAPKIVNGAARFCFRYKAIIDGIIITGDLATTGRVIDLQVAEKFVAAPSVVGAHIDQQTATIGSVARPIHLFPGNHDRYVNDAGTPNSPNFQLKFLRYMDHFDPKDGVGYWIKRKNMQRIAFVYADYTLQSRHDASSPLNAYGQGRVYSNTLSATELLTRAIQNRYSNTSIVWLIHFAPFDCGRTLELIDWTMITQAAQRLGVIATLCGHTHDPLKISSGLHTIYCAGSAGCIDREYDSNIHMFEFEIGRYIVIRRRNFTWSNRDQDFVEVRPD
ncbi:metallophosphoesterase [Bradyrhizobium sp. HKCCYLS2058]|uniref:metallophosphoesterase n=1 Tax=unclassified Bradyrhizobium TaxID=2631580 RepID=UPI003EBCFA84